MVRDLLLGQTVDRVRHSLDVPMLIARPDRAVPSPTNARLGNRHGDLAAASCALRIADDAVMATEACIA